MRSILFAGLIGCLAAGGCRGADDNIESQGRQSDDNLRYEHGVRSGQADSEEIHGRGRRPLAAAGLVERPQARRKSP